MEPELFKRIIDQIKPHHPILWTAWEKWVQKKYGIMPDEMSENHFFLYVMPKVLQLHGYGEPLLDKNLPQYIKWLTERNIPSYFSCNPANLGVGKMVEMFENGLGYVKFSIESVFDRVHKDIRGEESNFSESYEKILWLLEIKKAKKYKTVIVITMLDLNRPDQQNEWELLKNYFHGEAVYIYFKSQDTQWLNGDYHGTDSIHWSESCKHPWMSMTIKSNGEACQCMEDFNNEIVLGDTKTQMLSEIWNGRQYAMFRDFQRVMEPCNSRCDMKLKGEVCNSAVFQ